MKVNCGFEVHVNNNLLGIRLGDWSTIVSIHNIRLISVSNYIDNEEESLSTTRYSICFEYKDDNTTVNIRPPIEKFKAYNFEVLEVMNGLLDCIYNALFPNIRSPSRDHG